jgi:hypothetical protein
MVSHAGYAQDSLAAMELVLAQPTISSQLIDNLNANIHLRALLTDLFRLHGVLSRATEGRSCCCHLIVQMNERLGASRGKHRRAIVRSTVLG